ncbi:YMGG-like glycine zipper-containing protein [Vibrio spartinae]|uniref:Glycine zipper 2TM domain protein n=1 Tax=Vibrio spartinae TaxID=1918945 RepID=A0A1N6MA39_9VIBR|nr:YMGG-like glycine zipper-containing protein [Vibrio spartinae]SIO96322.1 Glycine zipper 2TM domain protein [Vibrio spartinae]
MIARNSKGFVSIGLFGCLLLSGCASTDRERTVYEGTAIGGIVGGTIGAVFGDSKGALIGGVIGAAVGSIYGDSVAKKKENYASTESYMNAVISEGEETLVGIKSERINLTKHVQAQRKLLAQLKNKRLEQTEKNQILRDTKKQAQQDLEYTQKLLAHLDEELRIQQKTMEEEKDLISVAMIDRGESVISSMQSEKRQLELVRVQLAQLDQRKMY